MPSDIQPLNREPPQMRIEVRRSFRGNEPKPLRNRANENARDKFGDQCPMSAAETGQLLTKQKLPARQRIEGGVCSAISDDLLTAENSKRVGISEDAENDTGIALSFFVKHSLDPGQASHSLGLSFDPGRQNKWINPAAQFTYKPRDLFQANDLPVLADY